MNGIHCETFSNHIVFLFLGDIIVIITLLMIYGKLYIYTIGNIVLIINNILIIFHFIALIYYFTYITSNIGDDENNLSYLRRTNIKYIVFQFIQILSGIVLIIVRYFNKSYEILNDSKLDVLSISNTLILFLIWIIIIKFTKRFTSKQTNTIIHIAKDVNVNSEVV